jgi:hypothetical protein
MAITTSDLRPVIRRSSDQANRWEITAVHVLMPDGKATVTIESQAVSVDLAGTRSLALELDPTVISSQDGTKASSVQDAAKALVAACYAFKQAEGVFPTDAKAEPAEAVQEAVP